MSIPSTVNNWVVELQLGMMAKLQKSKKNNNKMLHDFKH